MQQLHASPRQPCAGHSAWRQWLAARRRGSPAPMPPHVEADWRDWAAGMARAAVARLYSPDLPPQVMTELVTIEAARYREESMTALLAICDAPVFAGDSASQARVSVSEQ